MIYGIDYYRRTLITGLDRSFRRIVEYRILVVTDVAAVILPYGILNYIARKFIVDANLSVEGALDAASGVITAPGLTAITF